MSTPKGQYSDSEKSSPASMNVISALQRATTNIGKYTGARPFGIGSAILAVIGILFLTLGFLPVLRTATCNGIG
jgi:hypothetical protein